MMNAHNTFIGCPQAARLALTGLMLLVSLFCGGCGPSPAKARKELAALGKDYSADVFTKSAFDGDLVAVKLFVESGMPVNSKNQSGMSPLMTSVLPGNTEIVKYLVAHGADVNYANEKGETALLVSSYGDGKADVVKALLDGGANPNTADRDGATPLIVAAAFGRVDLMEPLVSKGASLNATNVFGRTALTRAVQKGHTNAVAWLLSKKAQWWLRDTNNMTASDHAIADWAAASEGSRTVSQDSILRVTTTDKRMDFKVMTFELTNAPSAMLALLRSHNVNIATPWLLERYAAETKLALVDTTYAERQADDFEFKRTRPVLFLALGLIDSLKYHHDYVGWFRAEMASMIHRQWVTAITGLPSTEAESAKAKTINSSFAALYRELRQGVPEVYLKNLPPEDAK